ncbi:MAG: ATP-binding protein [Methyloligellaceae bacterium]
MNPELKRNIQYKQQQFESLQLVLKHYRLPIIIMALGIGFSIVFFMVVLNRDASEIEQDFKKHGQQQFTQMRYLFDAYIRGKEIAIAGLQSSDSITKYQILKVIAPLIEQSNFSSFLWVQPDEGQKLKTSIVYIDGSVSMPDVVDVNKFPKLLNAIRQSDKENGVVFSEVMNISGSPGKNSDLLFISKVVHDRKVTGYLVGVLNLAQFFSHEMIWSKNYENLQVYIYDKTNNRKLIYHGAKNRSIFFSDEDKQNQTLRLRVPFLYHSEFQLRQRKWHVVFTPTHRYLSRSASLAPWSILIFGTLLSAIISILIFTLVTRNIKIKQEIDTRTEALKQSNDELEQFAYVASNDLKAPLRSIDQLAQWLEEDLGESLEGENKENMTILRGRVKRLETLLDDLLEYSKIGRKLDFSENNPLVTGADLVENIVQLLDATEKFSIEVSPSFGSTEFFTSPLQQVLMNLINNAIKHHDKPSGSIIISLGQQDLHYYKIIVCDDGPGIPEALHGKALQMFQTLRPRDKVEGSGMGLAMVKKIVEQFGGNLTLTNNKSSGLSIEFSWPVYLK